MTPKRVPKSATLNVAQLIEIATAAERFADVRRVLEAMAKAIDAYGCILWSPAPGEPGLHADTLLFVQSHWCYDNEQWAIHDLPLRHSIAGTSLLTRSTQNVPDIAEDARVDASAPFLRHAGILAICAFPLMMLDGTFASLCFYRTASQGAFEKKEISRLEEYASLIPHLYEIIGSQASRKLLRKVDPILRTLETSIYQLQVGISYPEDRMDMATAVSRVIKPAMKQVASLIADAFNCIEATILLRESAEKGAMYAIVGTTWPWKVSKDRYQASRADGLTGYVLANGGPVNVPDLANFKRDNSQLQDKYPGLTWNDSLGIARRVRSRWKWPNDAQLPPLTWMGVPILIGDDIVGAVRCCTVNAGQESGPYYFGAAEIDLLELFAADVSRIWQQMSLQTENQRWWVLVRDISQLNQFVPPSLSQAIPEESEILSEALNVAARVLHGADILDVRLHDEARDELYFAAIAGLPWLEGDVAEKRARRFPLNVESNPSIGADVFNTGVLKLVPDVRSDPNYNETFAPTRRMIVAPIRDGDSVYGVLDIRFSTGGAFPPNAGPIAELLGRQLGLYHHLILTLKDLRATEAELSETSRAQQQAFEDLHHQINGPLAAANRRSRLLARSFSGDDWRELEVLRIRGLCGKAFRVSRSIALFVDLARGTPLRVKKALLDGDRLLKLLLEAARDNEVLSAPERHLRVLVERAGFRHLGRREVWLDFGLLEQALYNVLDNAMKYSYSNSTVRIFGGITKTGRFQISIENKGIPISAVEARMMSNRGWRGEMAKTVSGEGTGIGLWIVDHIMRAHDGELTANPTSSKGLTEVRLLFPALPSKT